MEMTSKAQRAFEVYRDLGPTRTLPVAAELLGYKTPHLLQEWSSKYKWTRLVMEHDRQNLRAAVRQQEMIRESVSQQIVGMTARAAEKLFEIVNDDSALPVLDRHGHHMMDEDGNKLYRPLVKASTKAQAAQVLLGIGGHVPVKRTEHVDRTGEDLDMLDAELNALDAEQLERMLDGVVAIATEKSDES